MADNIQAYVDTAGALFYLYDEHDDCESSLVDGSEYFQHQVY